MITRIILPSETFLEKKADLVNIPGGEGVFGVLPGHAKIVSTVKIGVVSVFLNDVEEKYYVHGGVAQVHDDEVNIITEYAANISESNKTALENSITNLENELSSEEEGSVEAGVINDRIAKHKSLISFLRS